MRYLTSISKNIKIETPAVNMYVYNFSLESAIIYLLPNTTIEPRGFLFALLSLKGRSASSATPRGVSGWVTRPSL